MDHNNLELIGKNLESKLPARFNPANWFALGPALGHLFNFVVGYWLCGIFS